MQALARNGYTAQQVTDALCFAGGIRRVKWQVDLLNSDKTYKGDITPYCVRLSINHDSSKPIHRTMTLDMVETAASQTVTVQGGVVTSAGINYLTDLVRPYCKIGMPASVGTGTDGTGYVQFSLGIFKWKQPGAQVPGYAVVRHAEMSDLSYIVGENEATSSNTGYPFTLPPGAFVIDTLKSMLTNSPTDPTLPGCGIPSSWIGAWPTNAQITAVVPPAYTMAEGTTYLDEINKLLAYCLCYPLWVTELGQFTVTQWPPQQNYSALTPTWTFDTESNSIILPGLTEDILTDQVKNVVQVIVEDASRVPLYAIAKNNDPASPYNVATYGPHVDVIHAPGVPDASAINWAQGYANQMLNFHAFLTDRVTLPCAVVPIFQDYDLIALNVKQHLVAAGAPLVQNVIGGLVTPGLVVTETFQIQNWQIDATLPSPEGAKSVAGAGALTTLLEPHNAKSGHTMTIGCTRVTSVFNPGANNVNIGTS